jgi:hypothetical protein
VEQKEYDMFDTLATKIAAAAAGLLFVLAAASVANAKTYIDRPYAASSAGNQIEVIGDHGRTDAQLSRAEVEAMRWQAMADFYSRKNPKPITTEHSFGASKQRPVEPMVVSVASPDGFDWADAGIGASVGFAALLALSALLVVARRNRTRLATTA